MRGETWRRGILHQCDEYPCEKIADLEDTVSFITVRHRLKDLDELKAIGLEAFQAQIDQKLAILADLLEHYNDGRRKSCFCLAVTLMPLSELKTVMDQSRSRTLTDMPLKEKPFWPPRRRF